MYRSSAKLAAYLCRKYGMPMDRHNEVPDPYYVRPYG
jgi:hypothetical protein